MFYLKSDYCLISFVFNIIDEITEIAKASTAIPIL